MFGVFENLLNRVKAMFVREAALDLESEFVAHRAERQAELHRRANRYESEGLHGIAIFLRKQAQEISAEKPLASVLMTAEHLNVSASGPAKLAALRDERRQKLPQLTGPEGQGDRKKERRR